MSTNIATIDGVREACVPHKQEVLYVPQSMNITRFWGGKKNGIMLQLSISNSYILLNAKQIEELKIVLANYQY
jgi:hypothetical protein